MFAKFEEIRDTETPLHLELSKNKKRHRQETEREGRDGTGNMAQWSKWFLRTKLLKINVKWFVCSKT